MSLRADYPIYVAGEFTTTPQKLPVIFPFTSEVVAHSYCATPEHLEKAIGAAVAATQAMRALPVYARAEALASIADGLKARREEFAEVMILETAKPLMFARLEVDRAVQTFIDGAEETKRINGEWLALDRGLSAEGHEAIVRRFPVGLVAAIAPFNFPLNLVAHKIAPAIAAGCPIILKPASKTPLSALLLAELIAATKLPKGAVSILPMDRVVGDTLVTDDRFKLLTFTGSPAVGWPMKSRAGKKKIVLELGGNAAIIIAETGDYRKNIKKIAVACFGQSGQSCIHTQRIFVHEKFYEEFLELLKQESQLFKYDDPRDEKTNFSSLIDEKNAERIAAWVGEAEQGGAEVVCGGTRIEKTGFAPTILTGVHSQDKVCREEAFAPVVVVEKFSDFTEAIARVNDSDFGLQCGVFTNNLAESQSAYNNLEVGGVIINNVSSFRADHMPYGGVKDSGLGREGVRYALEDMTERRVLVINNDV